MALDLQTILSSPVDAYAEGLNFLHGKGMINNALKKLAEDLDKNEIDYVVIGAIALNQYGYRRFTEDIDLLMTREGLEKFHERLIGLGYRPAFEGAKKKFRASNGNVPVEVITAGEYPGDGKPKSVVFPEPSKIVIEIDGIKTVTLDKLIELKLASGLSAPDRLKDLADVQELIKIKGLKIDFAEKLDVSVREKFIELAEAVNSSRLSQEEN